MLIIVYGVRFTWKTNVAHTRVYIYINTYIDISFPFQCAFRRGDRTAGRTSRIYINILYLTYTWRMRQTTAINSGIKTKTSRTNFAFGLRYRRKYSVYKFKKNNRLRRIYIIYKYDIGRGGHRACVFGDGPGPAAASSSRDGSSACVSTATKRSSRVAR